MDERIRAVLVSNVRLVQRKRAVRHPCGHADKPRNGCLTMQATFPPAPDALISADPVGSMRR